MPWVSDELRSRLADERSKKVVFVSHCVLNENARYLGGAFSPGMMPGVAAGIEARGYGIVQMPCPEQLAWGGVLKPLLWMPFGPWAGAARRLGPLLLALFAGYSRARFRAVARRVARQIKDYLGSGFEVAGILGIDGSPSCGVARRLELGRCLELMSSLAIHSLDRKTMNERLYSECAAPGKGIFMEELERALGARGAGLAWLSLDLEKEMKGEALT